MNFNNDFLWGTASSGPQSEGNFEKPNPSIWDTWFEQEAERFYEEVGSEVASNVYNDFKEDINLMSEIGLNSFRTSIQWTRIIKNFETGEVNQAGFAFYINYFKELKKQNIKVIANLFHYDMPTYLQNKYEGFNDKKVVEMYVYYAKVCFEHLDPYVDLWTTFNEPMAYAKESYQEDRIYPCDVDFKKMMRLNYNMVLSHAKVVSLYKQHYKKQIGIIVDCLPPIPRSRNYFDLKAAEFADLLTNKIYLDPCILGEYPKSYFEFINEYDIELEVCNNDLNIIKSNTSDFIGINYYRPMRVMAPPYAKNQDSPLLLSHFFVNYEKQNIRMNSDRGWEIYPKAIYEIAMRIKNEYNNIPWYISENGMGVHNEEQYRNEDGIIEDDYRIEFLSEHLMWLNKSIEEGANCFGYHMWTFVDNWSWLNAYKNRYGFIEYNLKTGERQRKKSSYWMEEKIKSFKGL